MPASEDDAQTWSGAAARLSASVIAILSMPKTADGLIRCRSGDLGQRRQCSAMGYWRNEAATEASFAARIDDEASPAARRVVDDRRSRAVILTVSCRYVDARDD